MYGREDRGSGFFRIVDIHLPDYTISAQKPTEGGLRDEQLGECSLVQDIAVCCRNYVITSVPCGSALSLVCGFSPKHFRRPLGNKLPSITLIPF